MSWLRMLQERLKALTPRERAGLAGVLACAGLAALVWTWDGAQSAMTASLDAHEALTRARAVRAHATDPDFRERTALAANKVWRWSVAEASLGAARARAAGVLENVALQAGLGGVSVSAEEAADGEAAGIALTLSADFDWTTYLALLDALANEDIAFVVEGVEVAAGPDQASRMAMKVRARFLDESRQP